MILIDSNLVIYASRPEFETLRLFLIREDIAVSIVSQIEVLGYHRLTDSARIELERFLDTVEILPLTSDIARQAVHLRQQRKMSLGDSIIAATALCHDCCLATHNTDDFRWIADLELTDPCLEDP